MPSRGLLQGAFIGRLADRRKPFIQVLQRKPLIGQVRSQATDRCLGQIVAQLRIDRHRVLQQGFLLASVVFALLAVPLGSIRMRGARAWGALLSGLLVGTYYGMIGISEHFTELGVPAAVTLWFPNVCFATAGVVLLLRMRRVPG